MHCVYSIDVEWIQELVGRCFIEAWSMTEKLITEFKMPFTQRSGEYGIKFIKCSYVEGGKAEIYMEIEQVRRRYLLNELEKRGAKQVMIYSYPLNDPDHLAAKCMHRVQKMAGTPGMKSYERGVTDVVPYVDDNADDNAIYEELKAMKNGLLGAGGDEVN